MELDKRIANIALIYSVTGGDCHTQNQKGYFADTITKFKDLKNCTYGAYDEYNGEKDRCFLAKIEGDSTLHQFRYFIPECLLKPEEKKYRPYTLKEFINNYSLGDEIIIRTKDNSTNRHVLFTEYEEGKGRDDVRLGQYWYTFMILFNNYEIYTGEGWKPFGVGE